MLLLVMNKHFTLTEYLKDGTESKFESNDCPELNIPALIKRGVENVAITFDAKKNGNKVLVTFLFLTEDDS